MKTTNLDVFFAGSDDPVVIDIERRVKQWNFQCSSANLKQCRIDVNDLGVFVEGFIDALLEDVNRYKPLRFDHNKYDKTLISNYMMYYIVYCCSMFWQQIRNTGSKVLNNPRIGYNEYDMGWDLWLSRGNIRWDIGKKCWVKHNKGRGFLARDLEDPDPDDISEILYKGLSYAEFFNSFANIAMGPKCVEEIKKSRGMLYWPTTKHLSGKGMRKSKYDDPLVEFFNSK